MILEYKIYQIKMGLLYSFFFSFSPFSTSFSFEMVSPLTWRYKIVFSRDLALFIAFAENVIFWF